jgi:hypothetical protein
LYRHDESNEPTKEGPVSFVFFESPFTSVSTVGRGPPLSICSTKFSCTENKDILLSVQDKVTFYAA